ncbi:hypothetical protein PR001_g27980 [Phytophthora rubi]|uniref:DDE-1 domain-containing protein n=1 Tax=Phytophthora rubi TaxID=129364 RepID=A0A6A3HE72_9STRA|nr:hypothetical protein PR001_g27980 [Phytophthora rubi]
MFASTTAYTTVEQVGVRVVPALTAGSDSQRITIALFVRADGLVLPPHFVFKGQPDGEVEREVRSYAPPHVATCSVQKNAWCDNRVMQEWIEESFRPNVTGYSVLLFYALMTHTMDSVLDELGAMGTSVHFDPPGCTGKAQPLDVGVMSPLKTHLRQTCAQTAVLNAMSTNSPLHGMLDEASPVSAVDAQDNDTLRAHDVLSDRINESASEEISVCGGVNESAGE